MLYDKIVCPPVQVLSHVKKENMPFTRNSLVHEMFSILRKCICERHLNQFVHL